MEALISSAKINLRLKITGRRPDTGYHTLSMLNVESTLSDEIYVHCVDSGGVSFDKISFGDLILPESRLELERVLRSSDNLISNAAALFGKHFGVSTGMRLSMDKAIPAGAGLGGGSSNAAAILKYLMGYYRENLRSKYSEVEIERTLSKIALSLGADVPFSLRGAPAIVAGVGEEIAPLPESIAQFLLGMEVFIVAPQSPSPTVTAYKGFAGENPWLLHSTRPDQALDSLTSITNKGDFYAKLEDLIENDFEAVVSSAIPEVKSILALLRELGIGKVTLSGSGSAILILPLPQVKFSWEERSTIKSVLTHNLIKHFDGFLKVV
jgi:4-diphosphocytidyl-2-C-methyl-D-erythritol kinase